MICTRNVASTSHAKISVGTIMQEVTPNVGNLSSKWVPLKWDLILIKRIWGLIHTCSRSINLLSTKFCLRSNAFKGFWYTYICFDPNYRTVVVASIQMLLVQRIFDMVYFLNHHYYVHLLPIIIIYNPEETCCYARPASVIINCNTGLKCRTPSCHYPAFFAEYADSTTFAWILYVWQLKKGLNKNFRHEYYYQSSQNLYDHIFNCW